MRPPRRISVFEARTEARYAALAKTMSVAAHDVFAERHRQVSSEGWTSEHDDAHADGSMADAAACYAATSRPFKAIEIVGRGWEVFTTFADLWPKTWADFWWKPKDRRHNLVRAGALIIAEIERLDREAERQPSLPDTSPSDAEHCAGGVDPGWEECPKCGATSDDACGAEPLSDTKPVAPKC